MLGLSDGLEVIVLSLGETLGTVEGEVVGEMLGKGGRTNDADGEEVFVLLSAVGVEV